MPQRKSRSEMGLLNTNQVGRRLSAWQGHTGMLEHGGHPTVCRLEVWLFTGSGFKTAKRPKIWLLIQGQNHNTSFNVMIPYFTESESGSGITKMWLQIRIQGTNHNTSNAGAVAVEAAMGPSFSNEVKWGRVDAPRIFCNGELQTTLPGALFSSVVSFTTVTSLMCSVRPLLLSVILTETETIRTERHINYV